VPTAPRVAEPVPILGHQKFTLPAVGAASVAVGPADTRRPLPGGSASLSPPPLSEAPVLLPTLGDPLVQHVISRLTQLGRRGGSPVGRAIAADLPEERPGAAPSPAPPLRTAPSPAPPLRTAMATPHLTGAQLPISWSAAKLVGTRRDQRVVAGAAAWEAHQGAPSVPRHSGAFASVAPPPAAGTRPRVLALTSLLQTADRFMMTVPLPVFAFVLVLLLGMAAMFRRERRRAREAERVALSDPLTGLPNRLALSHRLAIEWERSRRYGRPLGVIALDLDDLKHVNDRHGHAAGDRLLCDAADILSRRSRRSDAVARLGGDEFVILVSETRGREMAAFADAVRSGLRTGGVSASVGYAELQAGDTDPSDLLARADADMYREKRGLPYEDHDRARIRRPDRAASLARSAKA